METSDKIRILQLSDIHFGADYDGKFATKNQFDAVCEKALEYSKNKEGFDLVVVTGDIADTANEGWYGYVLFKARELCNSSENLLVTPGNHDDREMLVSVLHSLKLPSMDSNDIDDLRVPGKQAYSAKLGDKDIVLLDTGAVKIPYEGISRIYSMPNVPYDALLFTHCPAAVPGKLYHRFMKDNMLEPDMFDLVHKFTQHYFCGHLHHMAHVDGKVNLHICPGIQCQIDPYAKDCQPTAISGFRVIEYGVAPYSEVTVTDYIIND